ncbi:MAG: 50S ribosomal protein L4 [Deltaproteobacteria bacterium]|nr:50S ribosomal protein L4 [Deltaproteobacteria bacterium]MBW2360510.1 50S ribosomal protein L4 [Deltaproteobacteria bacterium]
MATVDVVTVENKKAGTVDLDPTVFEVQVKPHLFHAEVRRQLAERHRGTHSTKNRTAVSGGGAKPWRQKGTGRARQGTTRAPQWKGGGAVFGPVPRDYGHKLPKKVRRAALCGALSHRLQEEAVTVVEALPLEEYKTKRVREMLAALGLAGQSVLLVVEAADAFLERSARNLYGVNVLRAEGLNVYDVLRHDKLVMTRAAVPVVAERLGAEARS